MVDPRIETMARAYFEFEMGHHNDEAKKAGWSDYGDDYRCAAKDALQAYRAHPRSKLEAAVVDAAVEVSRRMASNNDPRLGAALLKLEKRVAALQTEREQQDG